MAAATRRTARDMEQRGAAPIGGVFVGYSGGSAARRTA